MSRVWYTSDLHFGHMLVADIRGYSHPTGHDLAITEEWQRIVKKDDTVYVLGDIATSGYAYALDIIKHLPGRKHLIAGNHDPVHPMHRQTAAAKQREWLDTFETIMPFARKRLNRIEFLLSHFPYEAWGDGERPGSRYNQYRLPDMGMPLIHGHTHGTEREHGHQMHVGWDAWNTLVPQETIIDWLENIDASR